uniref:Uncharacterized protein n=2 Tax=Cercopithecinae TaxID=9528 RepID=A0A2K5L3Z7_CERAT|nr:unnamed protein product [Macaca fascicularis]
MCTLNAVTVGFIFKTIKCIDCFLFRKWRGLKTCKLPLSAFASTPSTPVRAIWGKESLPRFFWKGTNLTFFPLLCLRVILYSESPLCSFSPIFVTFLRPQY